MSASTSFSYFIESIQNAITLKQINDISIEFDEMVLSGKLMLHDEQWRKFTTVLNSKISLLNSQSSQNSAHLISERHV